MRIRAEVKLALELFVEPVINLEFEDESYRVVKESTIALMTEPDPASARIAEVLYNEPVKYVSPAKDGYCKIETADGISGFVKESSLVKDKNSIEPDLHQFKLIVSDPSKNVMTHASNGTLIKKVMMNTVLYADIKRELDRFIRRYRAVTERRDRRGIEPLLRQLGADVR